MKAISKENMLERVEAMLSSINAFIEDGRSPFNFPFVNEFG